MKWRVPDWKMLFGTLKRNKRKFPSQNFLAAPEMKSLVVFYRIAGKSRRAS